MYGDAHFSSQTLEQVDNSGHITLLSYTPVHQTNATTSVTIMYIIRRPTKHHLNNVCGCMSAVLLHK